MEEDLYLEYVREKAKEKSKIFMPDSGEGNDYFDKERGWDIEYLSGWLIDEDQMEKFNIERKNGNAYDSFGDDYCFAKCYKDTNGSISIEFKKFIQFYLFFCIPITIPVKRFFKWALPMSAIWNKKEENVYAIGPDGKRREDTG